MSSIIRFILEHYDIILSAIISLISFVVSLRSYIKAKRSSALGEILSAIPTLCAQIECLFPDGCGRIKLDYVLSQIKKLCELHSLTYDKSFYTEQVEKVLSAPSSKK